MTVTTEEEKIAYMEQELGTSMDMMGFLVLLKAIEFPEKTASGLFLTDSFRKNEPKLRGIAKVIGMGERAFTPLEKFVGRIPKLGDWVCFSGFEVRDQLINKKMVWFIPDDRIFSIVRDIKKAVPELN